MLLTIAMALWATNLLILLLLAIAILLILTVLIQRPQGGGLSAAFGSAGSGQTAFGTKTGDALTVFTVIMFTLFVLVAIGLNFAMRPSTAVVPTVIESSTPGEPAPQTDPALTPAPAPGEGTGVENPAPATNPGTTPGTTPEPAPGTQPAGEQPAPAPTPAPATEPTPEQPQTPPADPSNAPK